MKCELCLLAIPFKNIFKKNCESLDLFYSEMDWRGHFVWVHNHTFYKAKQNIIIISHRATSWEAPSITSKQIRHKKDQVTHNYCTIFPFYPTLEYNVHTYVWRATTSAILVLELFMSAQWRDNNFFRTCPTVIGPKDGFKFKIKKILC